MNLQSVNKTTTNHDNRNHGYSHHDLKERSGEVKTKLNLNIVCSFAKTMKISHVLVASQMIFEEVMVILPIKN